MDSDVELAIDIKKIQLLFDVVVLMIKLELDVDAEVEAVFELLVVHY